MSTEVVLSSGTETWDDVRVALTKSIDELIGEVASSVVAAMPQSGQRVEAHRLPSGQLRLAAAGNDSLTGGDRLTVRDERAVIAVGFSASSANWGNFYWDWTPPVSAEAVASGIVRTMRDIYKASPGDVEVSAVISSSEHAA